MFALIFSLISGCLYWIIEENIILFKGRITTYRTKILAALKWTTVFGLIIEHLSLHYHALYEKLLHIMYKSLIFLLYAFGDIIIIFNEPCSVIFFMIGHTLLLASYCFKILLLTIEYTVGILLFSIFITTLFGYVYRLYNKQMNNYVYGLYVSYIFVLSLILITPFITSGYLGGIFFVISDVLIGFKIKQFSKLTFPLYYTSLLCLLYLFTTN